MTGARPTVTVRVEHALRFLLPIRDRRSGERRLPFEPDATVGHLVQAAGVPLTEVGTLLVGDRPGSPADRTAPGCRIDVAPVVRPQRLSAGGFLLDVGLGALARRLRLLGLDAAWSADGEDAELVARAAAQDRVLLTQDRGLLMRRVLRRGALVRGARPDDQLADVLDRFAPVLTPLSRCTACGARLEPVAKEEIADRLLPGTRRTYDEFARCTACGRLYWAGAHAPRISALIRRATLGGTTEETDRGALRR